jgi:hypothetical protein
MLQAGMLCPEADAAAAPCEERPPISAHLAVEVHTLHGQVLFTDPVALVVGLVALEGLGAARDLKAFQDVRMAQDAIQLVAQRQPYPHLDDDAMVASNAASPSSSFWGSSSSAAAGTCAGESAADTSSGTGRAHAAHHLALRSRAAPEGPWDPLGMALLLHGQQSLG